MVSMNRMKGKAFGLVLVGLLVLGAGAASAQVLVGFQQRFYQKYGDGSTSIDSVPCCFVTAMNPVPTVDVRTIGQNMGAYLAEFKNKTAMVGNLFGFGTPAVLNGKGPAWYGFYRPATGGVTLKQGRYTSMASLMLPFPGGNLRRLTTMLQRTVMDLVMRPNNGPGNLNYQGIGHTGLHPAFRAQPDCTAMQIATGAPLQVCWKQYPDQAGQLQIVAGPNRFGGTRAILEEGLTNGVDNGAVVGAANRFKFPAANGPGHPLATPGPNTPMGETGMGHGANFEPNVLRETRSATFAQVTIMTAMQTTGMVIFQGLGTGWFTIVPFTTGTVRAIASTIGTPIMDFTHKTERGFITHGGVIPKNGQRGNGVPGFNVTGMGGITGTLQLVSGHLLQSRGGISTNLAGTTMTRITFTPEPASAAMLGAGVLVLFGMIVRDRRRARG